MLSQPGYPLSFPNPPHGFPLPLLLPLAPERSVGAFDAVALAVGLDRLDAAIPSLLFRSVGGPRAKLLLDVKGGAIRAATIASSRRLGEDAIRDGRLAPRGILTERRTRAPRSLIGTSGERGLAARGRMPAGPLIRCR
jgi:hypothetical protein